MEILSKVMITETNFCMFNIFYGEVEQAARLIVSNNCCPATFTTSFADSLLTFA